MMYLRMFSLAFLAAISACSTPRTTLVNPETGQVVTCGGSATGSMAGGVIGYNIDRANADDCVAEYRALGFERVEAGPDVSAGG